MQDPELAALALALAFFAFALALALALATLDRLARGPARTSAENDDDDDDQRTHAFPPVPQRRALAVA
ncbi:MAG: hypothetical protein Q8O67_01845 [Deltaproteobacteria bacterium]|nr:hypothetical protein [Deltaproteobacteria bacterium]